MTIICNSFLYHYNDSVIIEYLLIFIEQISNQDLMLFIKKPQFITVLFFWNWTAFALKKNISCFNNWMFYASSNVRMPLQTDSTYCTLIGLPAKNLSTFINETRYNANGKYTSYSHYCFVELCARYVDSLSLSQLIKIYVDIRIPYM